MALAMLCFSVMAALVKAACGELTSSQVAFVRSLISVGILLWIHYRTPKRGPLWGHHRKPLIARGLMGAIALNLYFFGLSRLPVTDAMLLNLTTPLFVLPLGLWLLGERLRLLQALLLPVALVGVVLVLRPEGDFASLPALAALGSAVFSAVAYILVRRLAGREAPHTVVFYFSVFSALGSLPLAALEPRLPQPITWLALLGIGALATGGQMFMTLALQHDSAGKVSIFGNLGVVFAVAWDGWFFGIAPDWQTVLGAVLIVGALACIQYQGHPGHAHHG